MIKKLFKENSYFYSLYLALLCLSLIIVISSEKGDAIKFFNAHHTPFFDFFFRFYTYIGTAGFGLLIGAIAYFLKHQKFVILLLCSYAINSPLTQLIKRYLIDHNDRPALYYYKEILTKQLIVNEVNGVHLHKVYSMPSGHTNTAFMLFLCLSLMSRNNILGGLFLLAATLVAISRMYLFQHFLIDTITGSFIAVAVTSSIYLYLQYRNFNPISGLKKGK